MNSFEQIVAALGNPVGGPWNIGDDPPLTVTYNPNTNVLVAALNAGVHITIYRSSWNGVATIQDCTGDNVDIGPHCLHTTAGNNRWFRQRVGGGWAWVTDCAAPTRRYLLSFDLMMNTLGPLLGVGLVRSARSACRCRGAEAPQVNRIKVGTITSPNPTLWINLLTLGQDATDYTIATASPGRDWMAVNQFCSILSTRWLTGGPPPPYGITNFTDEQKIEMAKTLIGFASMDDQVHFAAHELDGDQRSLEETANGVENGYPVGTQIWAGNDFHVVAVRLTNAADYDLYDSNTGLTTRLPRIGFQNAMEQLRCDAFVVRSLPR
ncbi:hypothetical protein [Sorangium sp. So ce1151]|uniref:hypothetical protein n=1 Tax=Sorangium sp. So ce1151 TaxID=3133332 RepID=UPI003F5EADE0